MPMMKNNYFFYNAKNPAEPVEATEKLSVLTESFCVKIKKSGFIIILLIMEPDFYINNEEIYLIFPLLT